MEAEVASPAKEDSSGYTKLNKDPLAVTDVVTSSVATPNCHNESSMSSSDSICMMETKNVCNNNKSGASPKLIAENKITTTNSQIDATTSDNQYFFEDEVFRIDKKGRVKFGLVMETSGDEELDDVLNKGEVRVVWYSKGNESVHSESSVSRIVVC